MVEEILTLVIKSARGNVRIESVECNGVVSRIWLYDGELYINGEREWSYRSFTKESFDKCISLMGKKPADE